MNEIRPRHRFFTTCSILAAFALGFVSPAGAQHEEHQTAGQTPAQGQAAAAACQEGAQQALGVLGSLKVGLDRARLTNDATDMRAAMDAMQAAVGELKIRLDACRPGGPLMPSMLGQAPGTAGMSGTSGQMSNMDHSKMNMGGAQAPGTPAMQPGSTKPAPGTPAADAAMPAVAIDPVSGRKPSFRHKAEYNGQTYYFYSEIERQKFVAAPEKYVKTK